VHGADPVRHSARHKPNGAELAMHSALHAPYCAWIEAYGAPHAGHGACDGLFDAWHAVQCDIRVATPLDHAAPPCEPRKLRAAPVDHNAAHLLYLAQLALDTSQEGVGKVMGVSRRTITRWVRDQIRELAPGYAEPLARAVFPADPELAGRIAAAGDLTLQGLGLVMSDPKALRSRLDSVICAAADALDGSPRAVRPVLYAAFRRAREEGLRVEQIEEALAPIPPRAQRTKG
jgi:hypothetical protein